MEKRTLLYMAVFDKLYKNPPLVDDVIVSKPILLGWAADAGIYLGKWMILGRTNLADVDFKGKKYKVVFENRVWVENFDGELLREATASEEKVLYNRTSYTPALFEHIIRAFYGIEPWDSRFDGLLPEASNLD